MIAYLLKKIIGVKPPLTSPKPQFFINHTRLYRCFKPENGSKCCQGLGDTIEVHNMELWRLIENIRMYQRPYVHQDPRVVDLEDFLYIREGSLEKAVKVLELLVGDLYDAVNTMTIQVNKTAADEYLQQSISILTEIEEVTNDRNIGTTVEANRQRKEQ